MSRPSVLLPQPLSPTRPERLAAAHAQRDAVDGAHVALGAAEDHPAGRGSTSRRDRSPTSVRGRARAALRGSTDSSRGRGLGRRLEEVLGVAHDDLRRRASSATSAQAPPRRAAAPPRAQRSIAHRAAIGEAAPGRQVARDPAPCPSMVAQAALRSEPRLAQRDALEQAARVRVHRLREEVAHAARARRPAPRTSRRRRCAFSATTPRSCVMRRMLMRAAACRSLQELEDLRLDGDVERRRRLVGDEELRLARERHGDHHALALPAGELVRVGVDVRLGRRDADEPEQLDGARARFAPRLLLVQADGLRRSASPPCRPGSGSSSAPGRSSRRRCRGPRASRARAARAGSGPRARSAPDSMRPGGRRDEPQDRERGHALAAAALADQRDRRRPRARRTTPRRPRGASPCPCESSSRGRARAGAAASAIRRILIAPHDRRRDRPGEPWRARGVFMAACVPPPRMCAAGDRLRRAGLVRRRPVRGARRDARDSTARAGSWSHPSTSASCRAGASGVSSVATLGRAEDASVAFLRFSVPLPPEASVLEAYLLLEPVPAWTPTPRGSPCTWPV